MLPGSVIQYIDTVESGTKVGDMVIRIHGDVTVTIIDHHFWWNCREGFIDNFIPKQDPLIFSLSASFLQQPAAGGIVHDMDTQLIQQF